MYSTLPAKFAELVQDSPERVACRFIEDGVAREFTYRGIYQDCLKVAHWLRETGLRPGDRVALILENRPEWCVGYFGILFAGGVAVPLDLQSRPEQLLYCVSQTRAKVIMASPQVPLKELNRLRFLKKIVMVGGAPPPWKKAVGLEEILAVPSAAADGPPLPSPAPDDLASIIYTSGTTALPKGVMLTHKNFLANFQSISEFRAITSEDNFLSILPLHHSFPFMATLLTPLFSRARITYLGTLKAESVLRCLKEEKITILAVTPQVLQHFYQGIRGRLAQLPLGLGALVDRFLALSERLSRRFGVNPARPLLAKIREGLGPQLRFFISGGAKLSPELARQFFRLGFTVLEGYGLTECAPVVSVNPPWAPKIGSVGPSLPGVSVKIVDPDPAGLGEIFIRGDNVMPGYYQNEAATREALQDGWFRSGDLGRQDAEGYLFIEGRRKDVIVLSSGKNISAEEVQQHYGAAPAIKEILALPDARQEKLVAVVVPDFDYFKGTGETDIHGRIKWFLEYYSQKLEPYKRVKDFVLINQELPKTRLGKVKRYEVEEIYHRRAGRSRADKKSALDEELSPLGRKVVTILLTKTEAARIALDDHLEMDLGLDSLALVELIAALEQRFQIKIRQEDFSQVFTVAEVIEFIDRQQPGEAPEAAARELSWGELLKSPPPPTLLQRINLSTGFGTRLFTLFCSVLFGSLFKVLFNLRVSGREHLGAQDYIICPNHASYLDAFLIFASMPQARRDHLFFMGAQEYFEVPVMRDLVRLLRVIPVDTSRRLVEAMQASAYVLRHGKILCIFPEGARSIRGEIRPLKKGVAILAAELGVKLLPTYISGSGAAWGLGAACPRPHPIRVTFGRPCSLGELAEAGRRIKADASLYDAAGLGLREELLRLKQ